MAAEETRNGPGTRPAGESEKPSMISLHHLLEEMTRKGASDLHITSGIPPQYRIDGQIVPTDAEAVTPEMSEKLAYSLMKDEQRKRVLHALAKGLAFEYVWPEMVVRNVHVFHAVICAFTASLWASGRCASAAQLAAGEQGTEVTAAAAAALGTMWLQDGWIALPRRPAASSP